MSNRSRHRYITFAIVYCLLVSSVLCVYFSFNRKTIVVTKIRHVEAITTDHAQPDAPMFSETGNRFQGNTEGINIFTRTMPTYNAYIMTVSNPKRISIVTTKYLGKVGQTVEEIVNEQHAIAGVNGGSFLDTNWQGNGGQIEGIVISDGKVLVRSQRTQPMVGFTSQGRLISGFYTLAQLESMNVQQALTFRPTLVQGGVGVVQGDGGWGYAPRTAIGQKADGTVIFIVTDGRHLHGSADIGATLRDIQNLMLEYGAVTAANLDGGSSGTMIYKGDLVNDPTDILGQRKIGTAVIVR